MTTSSMLNRFFTALCLCLLFASSVSAQDRLKPFVLASSAPGDFDERVAEVSSQLAAAGYELLGEYRPYDGAAIVIITSASLQSVALANDQGGFAATLRVAITALDDEIQVSYVNPAYLAEAYRLDHDLAEQQSSLADALGVIEEFGSKRGLKPRSLRRYHYMMGMEYFTDPYELGAFESTQAATAAVDQGLADNPDGLSQVYRLAIPDSDIVVYGVAMQPEGEGNKAFNDAYQMSIVDFQSPRSTAYLPYEIVVDGGEVTALHMRFRMAVHFPDLSMMGKHSFMTLMSSPNAIHKALEGVVRPD